MGIRLQPRTYVRIVVRRRHNLTTSTVTFKLNICSSMPRYNLRPRKEPNKGLSKISNCSFMPKGSRKKRKNIANLLGKPSLTIPSIMCFHFILAFMLLLVYN